jgi:hypothetical protein
MIATLDEIKLLLQITDSSQDALITALIPICEDYLIDYCNNSFLDNRVTVSGTDISFTTNNTIDSTSDLVAAYFSADMLINISGSILNEGVYTIASVSTNQILTTETTIVTEDNDTDITITRVVYPEALKQIISAMINESIGYGTATPGVDSESLGDYSISYAKSRTGVTGGTWSDGIMQQLNIYRKVKYA